MMAIYDVSGSGNMCIQIWGIFGNSQNAWVGF